MNVHTRRQVFLILSLGFIGIGIMAFRSNPNQEKSSTPLFDLTEMRQQAEQVAGAREAQARAKAQRAEAEANAEALQRRLESDQKHKKSLEEYRAKFSDEQWQIHEAIREGRYKTWYEDAMKEFAQAVTYLLGFTHTVTDTSSYATYNEERQNMECVVEFEINTEITFFSNQSEKIETRNYRTSVKVCFLIGGKNDIVCYDASAQHAYYSLPKDVAISEITISEADRAKYEKLFSKVIEVISTAPPS